MILLRQDTSETRWVVSVPTIAVLPTTVVASSLAFGRDMLRAWPAKASSPPSTELARM